MKKYIFKSINDLNYYAWCQTMSKKYQPDGMIYMDKNNKIHFMPKEEADYYSWVVSNNAANDFTNIKETWLDYLATLPLEIRMKF